MIFLLLLSLYDDALKAYNSGNFTLAYKKINRYINSENKIPAYAFYLAGRLEKDGKKAISYYDTIIKTYPNDKVASDALYQLGQYFYLIRDYKTAYDYFKMSNNKEAKELLKKISSFVFLQLGYFSKKDYAEKLKEKVDNSFILEENGYYRVWVGPFYTTEEANDFLKKFKLEGIIKYIK